MWQQSGYDFERHIKPVVDAKAARGVKAGTFGYFTPAIENAAQQKMQTAPKAEERVELTPEVREQQRKFFTSKGIQHPIYNPEGVRA
jgi:hypothetical protein